MSATNTFCFVRVVQFEGNAPQPQFAQIECKYLPLTVQNYFEIRGHIIQTEDLQKIKCKRWNWERILGALYSHFCTRYCLANFSVHMTHSKQSLGRLHTMTQTPLYLTCFIRSEDLFIFHLVFDVPLTEYFVSASQIVTEVEEKSYEWVFMSLSSQYVQCLCHW